MKKFQIAILLLAFFVSFLNFAQTKPNDFKIKIKGTIVEKVSKQPLEYATITFMNPTNPKVVGGGITNGKGEFEVEIAPGNYVAKVEFISFKSIEIKAKNYATNTNMGQVALEEDASQLNEVVIRSEKTTVEIKLDKKVYNVGSDLTVKGGTVSDVLDNIPSVTVDADGAVSLRGNSNVRILIDGKPSNAINIAEALRQIPSDAIDKVEVVTNPSARYDSEGGGGLLNIILKKGKNQGINGTVIATTGYPENFGVSGNINYKTEKFNLFTTTGYNYRVNPGNAFTNSEYFDKTTGATTSYINEKKENERLTKGLNSNFGMDWYLNNTTTWTNTINIRNNNGKNPETVSYTNFDNNNVYTSTDYRYNDLQSTSNNLEYSTNLTKKFKKEGHKWTIDGIFSKNSDQDNSTITSAIIETTSNDQKQTRNSIQTDYVFPFGKANQLELGYKGDFNDLTTDYKVGSLDAAGNYTPNMQFTNILNYKENINALYSQFGTKVNKFSMLFGLRWENSNININQLITNDFNTKKYNNFFPSAFLTYEISDESSTSLSYSRRVSRPRGRLINPFSSYSSNINLFQGNPDLDPSFTDALDLGYLKRWNKLTLNTSLYVNRTTDSFQFVRIESGNFVNGTPVIYTTPINLATEYSTGFEFTLNYSPYKWWKLNSNFNFYRNQTNGDYTYTNAQNILVTQNFDNIAYTWFTRLSSKVNLPYKIDWQTNLNYNGPQSTAQGHVIGIFSANLGFSKDFFKDKGTLALNIQDVFNSRKRKYDLMIPGVVSSYTEMQMRVRQINLSFTYRFNKKKGEKERQPKRDTEGGEEFQG
jgi:outer membrane receptor protein involved in Fe transport